MVIFLQRVSVRKLHLNFLIARRAGILYKSDQCPFHETFFPLLAYISDLEGGGHLAGRNGQFSPASPSVDQAGSLHSRCKIYIQIIFVFFFSAFPNAMFAVFYEMSVYGRIRLLVQIKRASTDPG